MIYLNKIAIINGANLNFTGIREINVYGNKSLAQIESNIIKYGESLYLDVSCFHSNIEGEIINILQKCHTNCIDGVIINAGAFTHYSYAIRDSISSINIPTVEVHMSNVHKRESFRHNSVIAPVCIGSICGFGEHSYTLALHSFVSYFEQNK